jgi:Thoeris protein ThsB, TIR-like domain
MTAWKAHEHIDFDFCDCQLAHELNSQDEDYIKRECRARIKMSGHYLLLIDDDTRSKHKYVRWEAEVAVEKGCTIIGVNLDKTRFINRERTPPVIQNVGVLFVTFSPPIIAHALKHFTMMGSKDYHYSDKVYTDLGYAIDGDRAYRPKPKLPDRFR